MHHYVGSCETVTQLTVIILLAVACLLSAVENLNKINFGAQQVAKVLATVEPRGRLTTTWDCVMKQDWKVFLES